MQLQQLRNADFVLIVASAALQEQLGPDGQQEPVPDTGSEDPLLKSGLDQGIRLMRKRVLGVVLPANSVEELPAWLVSTSHTVTDYTLTGTESLYRALTGQPPESVPGREIPATLAGRTGPRMRLRVGGFTAEYGPERWGIEERLEYRRPDGVDMTFDVFQRQPDLTSGYLPEGVRAEIIQVLVDGALIDLHQLTVLEGADVDQGLASRAYEQLDAEVLAGVRLARRGHGMDGRGALSRMVGRERPGNLPFVLLSARRGVPVAQIIGNLLPSEEKPFSEALLGAYRWIVAAGLAHRSLSSQTVRWDSASRTIQLDHFFSSRLIGTPRPYPSERSSNVLLADWVSDRDDGRAVAELLVLVLTGQPAPHSEPLGDPDLAELLEGSLNPEPRLRPSSGELLMRLGVPDPVGQPPDDLLATGVADFERQRLRKHPEAVASSKTGPVGSAPSVPLTGRGWFRRLRRSDSERPSR